MNGPAAEGLAGSEADQSVVTTVDKRIKLSWGTGALGVALLMNGISALVLFYMVGVLGIEPALAGALVFATKILDVLSDPIVGVWSDRIKSPKGRRRPFLVWGALISSLSFVMIFTTPIFEESLYTATYAFIAMALYTVGYTVFNVPYMAMPAEMTDDYHERSSIHAYRVVFVVIGGSLVGALGNWYLEEWGRDQWSSYAVLSIWGGFIILISMLIAYFGTAKSRTTSSGVAIHSFRGDLSAILSNKYFLRLIAVKSTQLLAVAASGAALIFFVVHSLQLNLKYMTVMFIVMTVVSLVAAPLMVKLSKRIGKMWAYMVAGTFYVLYCASWAFADPGESVFGIAIRGAIVGVAVTGNIMLAMSMLTDTIEYDAIKTGTRREGAYTAIYSFIEKVTAAFGPLIVGVALSMVGFNKQMTPEEMQSPAVTEALLFGVAYLPTILGVLAMVILAGFSLDENKLKQLKESSAQ